MISVPQPNVIVVWNRGLKMRHISIVSFLFVFSETESTLAVWGDKKHLLSITCVSVFNYMETNTCFQMKENSELKFIEVDTPICAHVNKICLL